MLNCQGSERCVKIQGVGSIENEELFTLHYSLFTVALL